MTHDQRLSPWRPREMDVRTHVVVMGQTSLTALAARSRAEPDAIVVDCVHHRLARDGVTVRTDRLTVAYVVSLAARAGAVVPTAEIMDLIYGDRADGGASNHMISVLQCKAMPVLSALGLRIEINHTRGRWLRCCLSPATAQELTDAPH